MTLETIVAAAAESGGETYLLGSRLLENLVFSVVGAVVGWGIQFAYDRSKVQVEDYELWFDISSRSLSTPSAGTGDVAIEYLVDGKKVQEPHGVDIFVWSTGKKDIRPDMFHDGNPIKFDFAWNVVKVLEGGKERNTESTVFDLTDTGELYIHPSLIHRSMARYYRIITDSRPHLMIDTRVADLVVRNVGDEDSKTTKGQAIGRWYGRATWALVILTALAFVLTGIFFYGGTSAYFDSPVPFVFGAAFIFFFVSGRIAAEYGNFSSTREVRRALRIRKRNLPRPDHKGFRLQEIDEQFGFSPRR